jgi:AGCS family alanine or glycine:cation symporter
VRLRAPQIGKFGFIMKETLGKAFVKEAPGEGDITPGQAGFATIGAVVGTGNIAGVATAIAVGGPGAAFWMWFSAFFGMATKLSEITLGQKYREKQADGTFKGGAMYYLGKGLRSKFLSYFFALMTIITYFVIGAVVDTNSIALALQEQWGLMPIITGIMLAVATGVVILGGLRRIAEVLEWVSPFMAGLYMLAGLTIIILNLPKVPGALASIFVGAFRPAAAAGGFAGATVAQMMKVGIARGLFSNEAGMGSSAIIHSSAIADHPVRQGIWGIAEVFVDTIIVCSITALAIIISGEWTTGVSGAALTMRAFQKTLPGNVGGYVVMVSLILFGYSCLLACMYYCEVAGEYLFGTSKVVLPLRVLWIIAIVIGSVGGLEFVWDLADTANGLMAIPNLLAVLGLSGLVVTLKNEFFDKYERKPNLKDVEIPS